MRHRRTIIRAVTAVLLCCAVVTCAGFSPAGGQSYAAAGIRLHAASLKAATGTGLSAGKLRLRTGQKKTLRMNKARSAVKWTSSNRKVAVVTDKRGKRGSVVTIRAKKAGKCTVTARVGSKKYKCRITVSKSKQLSSSSVLKSSGYSYDAGLGADSTAKFNYAAAEFSFGLLSRIAADEADSTTNNILISPDSVLTAMIMVENGARGNTLREMESVLSGGIGIRDFNAYLAGLNSRLGSSERMTYRQSNSIWVRKNKLSLRDSFIRKNKRYHNASFYEAPFNATTVKDINKWVYNNSRYMIRNIVDRLEPDDRMVLVNTTVFEGSWTEPFNVTGKSRFTMADNSRCKVDMMFDKGTYRYMTVDGGEGFVRPYTGDDPDHQIAFVGLLPPEGTGVEDYVKGITGREFIRAWKNTEPVYMEIGLPKFTYDYSASLERALADMGIRDAFSSNADLSGISAGGKFLQIDSVLHKTHIELDEEGTKAAAATAVMVKASSAYMEEPKVLHMDRPFLYALVDTRTGIPLFTGIIKKP